MTIFSQDLCTKFVPEMIFLYGERHLVLKPMNAKICEQSSFFLFTDEIVFLNQSNFKITKLELLLKPITQLRFLNIPIKNK